MGRRIKSIVHVPATLVVIVVATNLRALCELGVPCRVL